VIVEGTYEFPAPRATVYDMLQDPQVLVKALPGGKSLVQTAEGKYHGVMSVGVGPVSAATFGVRVELSDHVRPETFAMRIDGKGPIGFTRGTATVALEERNGVTTMHYRADLQVGGRIAGVGQRLLDSASKMMTRHGLEALHKELLTRFAPEVAAGTGAIAEKRSIWKRRIVIYAVIEMVIIVVLLVLFWGKIT